MRIGSAGTARLQQCTKVLKPMNQVKCTWNTWDRWRPRTVSRRVMTDSRRGSRYDPCSMFISGAASWQYRVGFAGKPSPSQPPSRACSSTLAPSVDAQPVPNRDSTKASKKPITSGGNWAYNNSLPREHQSRKGRVGGASVVCFRFQEQPKQIKQCCTSFLSAKNICHCNVVVRIKER